MTDLLAYHLAKQQMTDLRRTAGQIRLIRTARAPRALTNGRRVISSALSRVSTMFAIDGNGRVASRAGRLGLMNEPSSSVGVPSEAVEETTRRAFPEALGP